MTAHGQDTPDLVALWRGAYEAEKARREAVEAELARVKAAGLVSQADALPSDLEAVVVRYSFGSPELERQTRSYARTQLAAGAHARDLVAQIKRGGADVPEPLDLTDDEE